MDKIEKTYRQTMITKISLIKKKTKHRISGYIWLNKMAKILMGSHGRTLADFELRVERINIGHTRPMLHAFLPISINFITNLCGKDQWPHLRMSENVWSCYLPKSTLSAHGHIRDPCTRLPPTLHSSYIPHPEIKDQCVH